ncbi:uncharacterized protein ABDE67_021147 [Symphorus nematophorus]
MAAVSSLLSEEQFQCSICQDVFTHPITIPCGHNFCKNCITREWESSAKYQCPMCKDVFDTRPWLRVNTVFSEMADQFRRSSQRKASSVGQKRAKGGKVLCDVCTESKVKALKSCLMCLASYCETHLEPHHRIPGLKRHELINPVKNLEDRMCKKHDRPLDVFCKTDQMYACQLCLGADHKKHQIVPLKIEYEQKKAMLKKNEAELQQMILERQLKIQQIKKSVKLSKEDADREKADSVQVFTALIRSIERGLAQLTDMIEEKQKTTEKHAEGFIKELEEEISVLMKRSAELQQISSTEDHFLFLQSSPCLNSAPPNKDWTEVRVQSSYQGTVRRAVAELEETLSKEMEKLCADVELKRVRQFAVDVTLDPDTAHPALILSDDQKRVSYGDAKKNLPANPERFSSNPCVLGKQSFSSGRFYFEVEVKEKTRWDLGVAKESINRKGHIAAGPTAGLWLLLLKNGNEYRALDERSVSLSLKSKPEKVGVFVDYEEGLVSFYDVDAAALIYSFTGCMFTGKLHPFFGPGINVSGKNSAPLIISPSSHRVDTTRMKNNKVTNVSAVGGGATLEQECHTLEIRVKTLTAIEEQNMSAASCLLSEDQFLCSICLDVFTHPVTIPCGHNFCKNCITEHWDINVQCQCPLCKKVFVRRPELHVNTFITELAAQFRQSTVNKASGCSEQQYTKPGEVLCDVCTETKLKALKSCLIKQNAMKSCLVCLASYCETHLEPHHRISGLKRHELINPVKNLEDRMCKKHNRPLEVFCKTDQMCVCQFCTESDHKSHDFMPMIEEYKIKKAKLEKLEAGFQQMIQERQLKIQQIKQSVKLSEEDADRERADGVQIFTALIQSVERVLAQIIDVIEEKQKTTEKQAEGFIKELEEEISELMKRSAELQQLSSTEDHLQLFQSFPSLNPAPPTKDWTEVRVHSSYEGIMRRAVAQLEETLSKEMEKLYADVELKRVRQFAVDVTLDPDTANPYLILSDDEKSVSCGDEKKNLPDNPERFSSSLCVLGKQSFSSGRFYYEVQVKGKTKWHLGVARESVNRKENIVASPETGLWVIWLRNGDEYRALAGPSVLLSLKSKPQKVGVFVDYEEGLVSFYDVDAAALIYSFTGCKFTEKLYPVFGPCTNDGGINSAPLIISPFSHRNSGRQLKSEPPPTAYTSNLQVLPPPADYDPHLLSRPPPTVLTNSFCLNLHPEPLPATYSLHLHRQIPADSCSADLHPQSLPKPAVSTSTCTLWHTAKVEVEGFYQDVQEEAVAVYWQRLWLEVGAAAVCKNLQVEADSADSGRQLQLIPPPLVYVSIRLLLPSSPPADSGRQLQSEPPPTVYTSNLQLPPPHADYDPQLLSRPPPTVTPRNLLPFSPPADSGTQPQHRPPPTVTPSNLLLCLHLQILTDSYS